MNTIVLIAVALAVLNLISFGLMAYDKHCAKAGKWRISEKALFLAAACFGALGGVLGMQLCRHKTKHWYFQVFFPLLLIVQIVLLVWGYGTWLKP
ncbi:MAG: DUF1294 domain-containing protein [Clostridia bacterium]|nr:DUF1294 domain-containing protein [Clostridia bacterium]